VAARDPYQVLGVARDASEAQIKAAYRKLAKTLHPDVHTGDKKTADRFKEVTAAYDLLSDGTKRGQYDRGEIDADGHGLQRRPPPGWQRRRGPTVEEAAAAAAGQSRDDILSELFESMRAARNRVFSSPGEDVTYRLNLGLDDAAAGTTTRIKLKDGRMLDVKIPPGVREGHIIRLRGQGDAGSGTGPKGDAFVEIHLTPNDQFRLEGDDVHGVLPVTLLEAINGAKIQVPTLDGAVTMTIPAGTSGGRSLRLKGKGWPKTAGGRGDHYVHIEIALPPKIDRELSEFIERWSKAHPYSVRD